MALELELQDKVGVVTGGGQGIGLAVVEAMLREGMRVVTADIVTTGVDLVGPDGQPAGEDLTRVLHLDLTKPGAPGELVQAAVKAFGGLDVLVNNISQIGPFSPFTEITDEEWETGLTANLMTTVRACRAAVPHLVERGGAIVTIGSDAGELTHAETAPYSLSKAALMNLSKMLSKEYGADGVRSNLVAPGLTRTHATADLLKGLSAEHGSEQDGIAAFTGDLGMALPRFGTAKEVADLVLFLASPRSAQTTGAMVRIDGGAVPTV